jgi:3-dehydro-L-gulonate 2-dehydrogenase
VVLDMAMSQFSVGALSGYRVRGELLPVVGGFDADGMLTRDPAAIEASGRLLPIGFWKGSGLALLLDLVAVLLSGGRATHEIPADPERETQLSQVFVALDASPMATLGASSAIADRILADLHAGEPARYPGERTLETRRWSLTEGAPVDPTIWREVQGLRV